MNLDSIKGEWAELKGKFKAKWGKMTDEDIESYKTGDHQTFKERLREKYGYTKERADQEFNEFKTNLGEKKDQVVKRWEDSHAQDVQGADRKIGQGLDPHSGDRLN